MIPLARDNMDPSNLHVICMISNPARYQSRYDLYFKFRDQLERAGVQLWTVEIAHGNRPHVVTNACNPHHLQLRTEHELWHKENALNLLVQRLPYGCRYIAWIDADIEFQRWEGRKAWYIETMQQLQHYHVVQLFSQAVDMNYDREVMKVHQGFAYSYVNGKPYGRGKGYGHWHPGFAWACRREAWDAMGGLIDFAILGAADNHMAHAFIGKVRDSVSVHSFLRSQGYPESFDDWMKLTRMHESYLKRLDAWQERVDRYLRRRIGYVPGIINHFFHGKKVDRRYQDRWEILKDYNPDIDIARDWQGLFQLVDHGTERSIRLRDGIMRYFRQRNEDSIDAE